MFHFLFISSWSGYVCLPLIKTNRKLFAFCHLKEKNAVICWDGNQSGLLQVKNPASLNSLWFMVLLLNKHPPPAPIITKSVIHESALSLLELLCEIEFQWLTELPRRLPGKVNSSIEQHCSGSWSLIEISNTLARTAFWSHTRYLANLQTDN